MPDPARAIRTAVDRIPNRERGGGRQEGIRWAGKGNYTPPCLGSLLTPNRGWEAAHSEGREQYNTPLPALTTHAMNIFLNTGTNYYGIQR